MIRNRLGWIQEVSDTGEVRVRKLGTIQIRVNLW